jgi:hypothetical protein
LYAALASLLASVGCALVDGLLNGVLHDAQRDAVTAAAGDSPNERIQAQAADANRQIDGLYR